MAEILVTTNDWNANSPITDSDVIVTDTNAQDVNTNVDQKGIDYDGVTVAAGYKGILGSSGTPMRWNTDMLRFFGSGEMYLNSDDNNVAGTDAMDEVLIQAARNDVPIELSTAATVQSNCRWTNLHLTRGRIKLLSALKYLSTAKVTIGSVDSPATDAQVTFEASGNSCPDLYMAGGRVFMNSGATNATVAGGVLTIDLAVVTTCVIQNGGTVINKWTGTSTFIVMGGGHLDLGSLQRQRSCNITLLEGSRISNYIADLVTGTVVDHRVRR